MMARNLPICSYAKSWIYSPVNYGKRSDRLRLTLSTIASDGQNLDIHPRDLLCPVV